MPSPSLTDLFLLLSLKLDGAGFEMDEAQW